VAGDSTSDVQSRALSDGRRPLPPAFRGRDVALEARGHNRMTTGLRTPARQAARCRSRTAYRPHGDRGKIGGAAAGSSGFFGMHVKTLATTFTSGWRAPAASSGEGPGSGSRRSGPARARHHENRHRGRAAAASPDPALIAGHAAASQNATSAPMTTRSTGSTISGAPYASTSVGVAYQ